MVNNKTKRENYELILEISKYMYHGFTGYRAHGTLAQIVSMVTRNFHHVVYMKENNEIVGVAIFFMLTDETLGKIERKELDLKNPEVFRRVEQEEGSNMHVFNIRAASMRLILKGTRDVIKNLKPKTISYYKDDGLKNLIFLKGEK